MTSITQHPDPRNPPLLNLKEKWVEHWATNKGYTIIKGTQQTEVTPTAGIPDYYLPQHQCFIEEKRTLKDRLQPHQLDRCLYLKAIGYQVTIAIRNTGAIIPLTTYLQLVKYNPNTWKQIL